MIARNNKEPGDAPAPGPRPNPADRPAPDTAAAAGRTAPGAAPAISIVEYARLKAPVVTDEVLAFQAFVERRDPR